MIARFFAWVRSVVVGLVRPGDDAPMRAWAFWYLAIAPGEVARAERIKHIDKILIAFDASNARGTSSAQNVPKRRTKTAATHAVQLPLPVEYVEPTEPRDERVVGGDIFDRPGDPDDVEDREAAIDEERRYNATIAEALGNVTMTPTNGKAHYDEP